MTFIKLEVFYIVVAYDG